MEEIKKYIASKIFETVQNTDILLDDIYVKIEVPKEKSNGDFAYPCFMLAKVLRNSPINIANDIKSKIKLDERIEKVEVVSGYLNFYLNNSNVVCNTILDILNK